MCSCWGPDWQRGANQMCEEADELLKKESVFHVRCEKQRMKASVINANGAQTIWNMGKFLLIFCLAEQMWPFGSDESA